MVYAALPTVLSCFTLCYFLIGSSWRQAAVVLTASAVALAAVQLFWLAGLAMTASRDAGPFAIATSLLVVSVALVTWRKGSLAARRA